MANCEITFDNNLDSLCIPLGAAVSAKFRGAFCEAIVNRIDRKIYCRIQLDDKKTIKVKAEDIVGNINTNNKVKVNLDSGNVSGIVLKIIDNSMYHVVFNDDDTGTLRRNQLVLKGDRHYKLSECLDRHPLTNPEHFTKAVINDKRMKDKSEADEEEFDNEEAKSCSQESMTTVSSSKTRSRQQTMASSASVGTGGSSVTVKTLDDVQKATATAVKPKRNVNIKYSIGSLVIVNKIMLKMGTAGYEKLEKKSQPFVGLIVPSSLFASDPSVVKVTQCIVKSFRDNNSYVAYKRDLAVVVKRDVLLKHKESDHAVAGYVEKCILFFDAKILPDNWDRDKILPTNDYHTIEGTVDSDRTPSKKTSKLKRHSPRTSISTLDSLSNVDDNESDNDGDTAHSNEDDQNAKDEWVARFFGFWEDKGSPINNALEVMGCDVDIYRLYELVKDYGGFQKATSNIRWPHLYHLMKLPTPTSDNYQKLQMLYKKYIFPYVDMKKKLGTFEQIRNRRDHDRTVVSVIKKARPLLTARERREFQLNVKKTEACSVSSQSVCEQMTDKVVSGDEIGVGGGEGGGGSVPDDACHLSQCSSGSPKHVTEEEEQQQQEQQEQQEEDCDHESTLNPQNTLNNFPVGTLVSVAYGKDKIYKAKIITHHGQDNNNKVLNKLSPSYTKPNYQPLPSIDSVSNADSTGNSTTGNDPRSDLEGGSVLYRVHYIGWNNRHDETIGSDRIIGVLSDTGQDSQSACSSSRGSQHREQPLFEEDSQHLQQSLHQRSNDDQFADSIVDDGNDLLLPDISDVSLGNGSPDSGHEMMELESKTEAVCEQPETEKVQPLPVNTQCLKRRRRSHSACIVEPDHIIIKRLPIVPESRIIASLNLYKTGDKMPKRPIRKQIVTKDEKSMGHDNCKRESDQTVTESSSSTSKRHSGGTDDSERSVKIAKLEMGTVREKSAHKSTRLRSPSFSDESHSDASTASFRLVDEESLYFLIVDNDQQQQQQPQKASSQAGRKSEQPKSSVAVKVVNKRGRKPLNKHDKKLPGSSTIKKMKERKPDPVEVDSNSSQHSDSGHGKRVTRSVKTASDQNTVDDNSLQLEEDSQTSQDGSGFQLPLLLQSTDNHSLHRHGLMTPLATGTPTSSHKGRRPKQQQQAPRRKHHNSQSNSSAECQFQDSNGEANNSFSFSDNFTQPKLIENSPIAHNRPPGRSFQRLHPSLIPNDLQKLPPEDRVKLLESLIRQTHLNFLDTKDKLKYVEKRISEIKTSRANGHSIESDEEKFR